MIGDGPIVVFNYDNLTHAEIDSVDAKITKAMEHAEIMTIAGPCNVTIKLRNGTYRKVDLIGGERVKPSHTYVGKKGRIIGCFKPTYPARYSLIEFDLDDALNQIDGFKDFMQRLAFAAVAGVPVAPAITPAEPHDAFADPTFASW
jgi:hypothetical protein